MDTSALTPLIPEETQTPVEQKYDAFYAASMAAPKDQVEDTYDKILGDLSRLGSSDIIEGIKQQHRERTKLESATNIDNLLLNTSIPLEDKRKGIEESLSAVQKPVEVKEVYKKSLINFTKPVAASPTITERVQGVASAATEIVAGLPAGVFKTISLIFNKDVAKAKQVQEKFQKALSYDPDSPGAKQVRDDVFSFLKPLGAFNEKIYEREKAWAIKQGVAPHTAELNAMATALVEDPLSWMGGALVVRRLPKKEEVLKAPIPPTGERIEPTLGPAERPVGVIKDISTEAAADLLAKAVNTPKMADAIGTNPDKIVRTNLLFKPVQDLQQIYPDIALEMERNNNEFITLYERGAVDPFIFDAKAISNDLEKFKNTNTRIESGLNLASSTADINIDQIGPLLIGEFKYGKTPNVGFPNTMDGFLESQRLVDEIAKQVSKGTGVTVREAKRNVELILDPNKDEFFINWKINKRYDPRLDMTMGTKAVEAHFMGANVSSFANTPLGKTFFHPRSRMSEGYTTGMALSSIHGNNFGKEIERMLFRNVVKNTAQKEVLTAMQMGDVNRVAYTITDLKEMFPEASPSKFKEIVKGYTTLRQIAHYEYIVANDLYRGKKVAAGYKGLYDNSGKPLDSLGLEVFPLSDTIDPVTKLLVKGKKELKNSADQEVTKVFDFTLLKEKGKAGEYKGGVDTSTIDITGTKVYRLDKPIKVDGVVYEFGIGVTDGPIKPRLLPEIVGFYPHVNMEHYFVKAEPDVLNLGGVVVKKDLDKKNLQLYKDNSSTVGYGKTMLEAEQMAAKLAKENPNSGFTYKAVLDRSSFDDTLLLAMDSIRLGDNLSKSRGSERLKNIHGEESRLKDPLLAIKERFDQVSKMYSWRDLDLVFRKNFLEEFGDLVEGKFPQNAGEISIDHLPDSPLNPERLKRARLLYEQYARQHTTVTSVADTAWSSGIHTVADFVESKVPDYPLLAPIADKLQATVPNRNPIEKYLLKGTTAFWLHWDILRQLLIQPTPALDLFGLAALNKNTDFVTNGPALITKLFWHTNATKLGIKLSSVAKALDDTALAKELGIKERELHKIYSAFDQSGIGNSIDLAALTEGVFAKDIHTLSASEFARLQKKAGRTVQGAINLPKVVGYDSGELLNQISAWVYARSEFIQRNPDKDWFEPTNQAIIHGKQWEISKGMTTSADKSWYQDGMLRFLTQFAAATNKTMMEPFTAPYLRKDEKIKLAAVRMALYGKRGVMFGAGAYLIGDYLIDDGTVSPEDKEAVSRGGADLLVNQFLRYTFDDKDPNAPKTDLAISRSLGPAGELGIPFGSLILSMVEFAKGQKKGDSLLPAIGAYNSVTDAANEMWSLFQTRGYEDLDHGATLQYIAKGMEISKGWNNARAAQSMAHLGYVVDRAGNTKDLQVTLAEAYGKAFGIQTQRSIVMNEANTLDFRRNKQIDEDAKEILSLINSAQDIYDGLDKVSGETPEEAGERAAKFRERSKYMIDMYDGPDGERSVELEEALKKVKDKHAKGGSGLEALAKRIRNSKDDKYKAEMQKSLGAIMATGSDENKRMIERILVDIKGEE